MRTLQFTAIVKPDHTLTVSLPTDITPGPHHLVVMIQESTSLPTSTTPLADLPGIDAALVDPTNTFRRENMYGASGR